MAAPEAEEPAEVLIEDQVIVDDQVQAALRAEDPVEVPEEVVADGIQAAEQSDAMASAPVADRSAGGGGSQSGDVGGSQRGSARGSVSSSTRGARKAYSTSSLCSTRTSLSSMTRRRVYGGTKKSPLLCPPPFDLPCVDQFGFPCALTSPLDEGDWDERHHLNGSENELKPKGIRDYFSKIETPMQLKRELKYNTKLSNTTSLLRSLSLPEVCDRKPSFICPDAGPPLVPTRHVFGGNMKDRDGSERLWNDRWTKGISILNDNCHPDHRSYFTQKSLFEESPSQDWRRYMDQEVAHGVWKTIRCKKKEKFPPLGGRLRGRSGTPIPGAFD